MPKHPGRTALYRLFDRDGRLLYVGISRNPDVRWGQHSLTKDWWHEVERRETKWLATRTRAEDAERQAIQTEHPRYNTQHRWTSPPSSGIKIPEDPAELYAKYRKALEERRALEPQIKAIAARALREGAPVGQLAKLTGMTPEVFRRIARTEGVQRRREPTVGREAEAKRAGKEPK
ncbi:GIY-YIG nuclease family protein [Streptomyces sp. NPDC005863]|uniref:GIY-YIG nuclease family protein n=1 Tax=Streptomyces sp. NPDC005863 TaxID=3364735 RepID=UPI0036B6BD9E